MYSSVLDPGDAGENSVGEITTLTRHEFWQWRQIKKNVSKKICSMAGVDERYRDKGGREDQGVLIKNDQEDVSSTVTLYTDMMEVTEQS